MPDKFWIKTDILEGTEEERETKWKDVGERRVLDTADRTRADDNADLRCLALVYAYTPYNRTIMATVNSI